jgi:hypothetical protein
VPPKFPPAAPAVEAKAATWSDLRAALEAGNQVEAERIAYSLGISASAVEGLAIAVSEAAELRQTLEETKDSQAKLDEVRSRLMGVRSFSPTTLAEAEERILRETELVSAEARLSNAAGTRLVAETAMAALYSSCPELLQATPGFYRGIPRGKFGLWLQDRGISAAAGWWRTLESSAPKRQVRIVAAAPHSGK